MRRDFHLRIRTLLCVFYSKTGLWSFWYVWRILTISGSRLKHFKNKTKLAQGSIDASKFMQNFLLLWAERKAMSSNSKNSYSKLLVSFYIIWVFWGVQRYNHNFVIWCRCWKSIVVTQLWKLLFWFHTKYSIWNIQLNQKDH